MMDAQNAQNETTPESVTIDPHGYRDSGREHSVVSLTSEDQNAAVQKVGSMTSLMLATGMSPDRVVKSGYLSVIGTVVNLSLLSSCADVRGFVTGVVLPTLDRLEKDEASIREAAAKDLAAKEAETAVKH